MATTSLSTGGIVGIAIGSFVFVLLIIGFIILLYCCVCKKRRPQTDKRPTVHRESINEEPSVIAMPLKEPSFIGMPPKQNPKPVYVPPPSKWPTPAGRKIPLTSRVKSESPENSRTTGGINSPFPSSDSPIGNPETFQATVPSASRSSSVISPRKNLPSSQYKTPTSNQFESYPTATNEYVDESDTVNWK